MLTVDTFALDSTNCLISSNCINIKSYKYSTYLNERLCSDNKKGILHVYSISWYIHFLDITCRSIIFLCNSVFKLYI